MQLTQAEFAKRRGVSKGCVSNWKAAGLLVLVEGPNGKPVVDVDRTEAKLNTKLDPMRGRPATGGSAASEAPALPLGEGVAPAPSIPANNDLADERLQELRERRFGAALKNAQAARQLVLLAEAERRCSEMGRVSRERIQSALRGLAERLAAETDTRAVMVLLETEVDRVFAELADLAEQGGFAGDDDAELSPEEIAEQEAVAQAEQ